MDGRLPAILLGECIICQFLMWSNPQIRGITMQTQTEPKDETLHWRSQAAAQLESVREMVAELTEAEENEDDEAREAAEQRIQEDALSVQVRGDWHSPTDDSKSENAPVEYRILLCTGGPAVQIRGNLGPYGEPETAELQGQDWFQPWQNAVTNEEDREALLRYARCFYFGE
jgi:hypothetical protein